MPDSIPYGTVDECRMCGKEFSILRFDLANRICEDCKKHESEAEDE